MRLHIKYMVSIRCKMVVRQELEELGLHPTAVNLGEVDIAEEKLTDVQLQEVASALLKSGLELMDDRRAILIEKIKNVVVEMVHYSNDLPKVRLSDYISNQLKQDYAYLSALFSHTEAITIEHFFIKHKIERVKELLMYNELTLTEIADKLNYSSTAHLSTQFKKVTGLTPKFFKAMKDRKRLNLETI